MDRIGFYDIFKPSLPGALRKHYPTNNPCCSISPAAKLLKKKKKVPNAKDQPKPATPNRSKRPSPKAPPSPDPQLWHLYRVNRRKTIFWQLPMTFLSERAAELEASWLGSLAVVQGKSYFYIVLDGSASLHLWLGYDVRSGKLPAHYRQAGQKPVRVKSNDNAEESGWWVE